MGDIRDSVLGFLQRTKAKFDYYAGGQFLRRPKTKTAPLQHEQANEQVINNYKCSIYLI
jgi:hypothetical protein